MNRTTRALILHLNTEAMNINTHCLVLHLNWSYCHIDAYLILSQFFQSSHDEPDVVEVLYRSTESLVDVFDKVEDLVHPCPVGGVAVFAEAQAPGSRFRA